MIGGTGTLTGRPDRTGDASGAGTVPYRQSTLELAPLDSAIPCFRLHAVAVLHEWNLPRDLIGDAALLVSELMTNARATSLRIEDHPPITLRLLADQELLVIEAWDQSPHDLEPFTTEDDAESGRGLMIVEALSTRWGSRRTGYNRKCVWAELDL